MKFPILSLMLLLPQQVHPFAFTTQSSVRHDTRAFMSDEKSEAPEGDKHAPVDSYREGISAIKGKGSTGGQVQASKPKSVVMKFGGSSLATAERIDHVANLIKEQIELGSKPRAVVCSAMGKTTNTLLSAGDFALEGRVDVDALRTLHMAACNEFDLDETTSVRREVTELLDEVRQLT